MPSEQIWDAIILGAGMSGLVSASVLHRQGYQRILIIDEYDRVGGNHIHRHIGPYTFDVGTLIFQDDSPLMAHFPELLAIYHPVTVAISRVAPDGKVRPYPFSFRDEVVGAGPVECVRSLASVALGRLPPVRIANAADFARYWIGRRVFERSGLANYIERFYGAKPAEIDKVFAEKRMERLAHSASLRKRIGRALGAKEPWNTKQEFVRPREGFDRLYDAARQALARQGTSFALGTRLESIAKGGSFFSVKTDGMTAVSASVFATIPLKRTLEICGLASPGPLPAVELISLFYSFKGKRGFAANVLYNFTAAGRWKRVTMYSDFFGQAEDREFFTTEVNQVDDGSRRATDDVIRSLADDFRADTFSKGLFDGDLVLEGSHVLHNAYPIYRQGAADAADAAIESLRCFGIKSFGRQGGFDYLPTARAVTVAVEAKLRATGRLA